MTLQKDYFSPSRIAMPVEFRILGRLELRHHGVNRAVGSLKLRTFLAALLLHPDRVVPLSRLADMLWGDASPPSAMANLRTYANRLRQLVQDGSDRQRLTSRDGGYRLRVGPDELDVQAFMCRASAGRAALGRRDHVSAARHLGEARALCRGPVLEDVPSNPALAGLITAVEEDRLAVVEDHISARLSLGEHMELIGELRSLVANHPLREGLWQQLILALYRSGDPCAALIAFSRYRRTIAERLGLQPSPEALRLHHAVLTRDPALTEPPGTNWESPTRANWWRPLESIHLGTGSSGGPKAAKKIPRELPAKCATFVGRSTELMELVRLLTQRPSRPQVIVP